jgi:hypothetical protein
LGEYFLKKTEDYRAHAAECRQLARSALTAHERAQLERMALTWESLATDREDFVARHPELSKGGEIPDSKKPLN